MNKFEAVCVSIGRAMIVGAPSGELAMVARKPPRSFQGEAYFANDRQVRFVRQRSTR